MTRFIRLGLAGAALLFLAPAAPAQRLFNRRELAGTVVDYTNNGRHDRRIWSDTLGQKRDLYVYLPPGYDPCKQYPVLLWLHGLLQDERAFVADGLSHLDRAMACGRLVPTIVVIPDGTLVGRSTILEPSPLHLNCNLGRFEDFIVQEVWPFVRANYPVRPEREAHAIAGFSAGGAAAYRIGFRYREEFGVILGISPPLNVRWLDCRGRYFGNFDPGCQGWREELRPRDAVGRFYLGLVTIRMGQLTTPLYGRGPHVIGELSRESPAEMLDHHDVRPGEFAMFVGYGSKDQFNLDAQCESFVYRAHERGLEVTTVRVPNGRHNLTLAQKVMPAAVEWLGPLFAGY